MMFRFTPQQLMADSLQLIAAQLLAISYQLTTKASGGSAR